MNNKMEGKEILNNCPQDVKDIIEKIFGTLDDFYGYVYQLNINQYVKFKKTGEFDNSQIDRLKQLLEKEGIDFMLVDTIVDEIGNDFGEVVAENYARTLLGENWREKLKNFDKLMDNL